MARLGDAEVAAQHLRQALDKRPTDSRARDHLARLLIEADAVSEAAEVIATGLKLDPTNWRLHRNHARLLELQAAKPEVVKATYDTAIRYRQGDSELLVEYGAFLFRLGEHKRASAKFSEAHKAELQKRRSGRPYVWREGGKQRREFRGQVQNISGGLGIVVAAPEGFKARFWRSDHRAQTLKQGDAIEFTIQFNSMGPEAIIRHPRPPR
jgi:tetratricopeptide (TPR) repeat protein